MNHSGRLLGTCQKKYVDALEENRSLVIQAIHYISKLYKIESETNDARLTTE